MTLESTDDRAQDHGRRLDEGEDNTEVARAGRSMREDGTMVEL